MRNGEDLAGKDGSQTFEYVYTEMLLQICRDYPGLPDPRTLKAHEIVFFYGGLRAELKKHSRG